MFVLIPNKITIQTSLIFQVVSKFTHFTFEKLNKLRNFISVILSLSYTKTIHELKLMFSPLV